MDTNGFPSSTRRATLFALGAGAATAFLGARSANAQAGTPTAASVPTLFVQGFGEGKLAPDSAAGGNYTLTLSHGVGWTLYFTDRPERLAGVIPTESLLELIAGNRATPPNAAVVADRTDAATEATVWVVTLLAGSYDAAASTLTYQARIIAPTDPGADRFPVAPAPAPAAAQELGAGHLFIDPYNAHNIKPVNGNIVINR